MKTFDKCFLFLYYLSVKKEFGKKSRNMIFKIFIREIYQNISSLNMGDFFSPHTTLCINLSVEISVFPPICNTASIDFSFLSYVIHQKHRGVWEVWRSGLWIKYQIRWAFYFNPFYSVHLWTNRYNRVTSALELQK